MRILHITDFHFIDSVKSNKRQNRIVEAITNKLQSFEFDLVLFTGDLVFAGNNIDNFKKAKNQFIDILLKKIRLKDNNFFICPGNHDINRNDAVVTIINNIKNFNDNLKLEEFIKKEKKDYELTLTPSRNYTKFAKDFYKQLNINVDVINDLYSVHNILIDKINLGIVCLNSAWLSYNDNERGTLLFPISHLEEAISKIQKAKLKIILLHHPLKSFKYYNMKELENLVYEEFDFIFSGDIHKKSNGLHFSSNKGIIEVISPATLTKKNDGRIGFSIINYDNHTEEVNISVQFYDDEEKIFNESTPINIDFPRDAVKTRGNKLRKAIRNHYENELENANSLFIFNDTKNNGDNFLKIFTTPILKTKDMAELNVTDQHEDPVNYDSLINNLNSYLIYGKDKSGKTCLLKKIQLDLFNNFHELSILPLFIDVKKDIKDNKLEIEKILKSKFTNFSNADIDKILIENKVLLLIDNLDLNKTNFLNTIIDFIKEKKERAFIATTDYSVYSSFKDRLELNTDYTRLFIHNVSKKNIRELAKKALVELDDKAIDQIIENLVSAFRQFSLPFNFWTISMFLWIARKTKHYSFNNSSEFIDNYIDELLDKDSLANDEKNTFSFENYKTFFSDFAFYLYTNFRDTDYKAKYVTVIEFISKYLDDHFRTIAKPKDILDYALSKNILKYDNEGNITFRLNGDFEYFLAYYMSNNEDFRNHIIGNDSIYLSFSNELELYSGINRKDIQFLKAIYEKTINALKDINDKYNTRGTTDNNLLASIDNREKNDAKIIEITNSQIDSKPLSTKEQDEFEDHFLADKSNSNYDVKKKQDFSNLEKDYIIYEKYLFILCRVFRNSDQITDRKLAEEIFDFIMNSYCNLGFLLTNEFEEYKLAIKNANLEAKKAVYFKKIEKFIDLTLNYIPVIIQVSLYYGIGHINLVRIIESKINRLKNDQDNNQFLIFILNFLLTDINLSNNIGKIDELKNSLNINSLISNSLTKLLYYYTFKSYDLPEIQSYLINKIKEFQKKLNPTIDSKQVDKSLREKTKIQLVEHQKE